MNTNGLNKDLAAIGEQLKISIASQMKALKMIEEFNRKYNNDQVIMMLRQRGMSYNEIAKSLNMSTSTVYNRLKNFES